MVRLIGDSNESEIVIDDVVCKALIDSGAQVSTITTSFAKKLHLPIKKLKSLLNVEGTGGIDVAYKGYVEANLKFPEVKAFNEDALFLVINDSAYGEKVPIQIGTLHIDRALELASEEELKSLSQQWKRGRLATILASKSVLLKPNSKGEYDLDQVKGDLKLTKKVTLAPFETIKISGMSKVQGHEKRVNVITESTNKNNMVNGSVCTVPCYTTLKPGSRKVHVALRNISCKTVTLTAKTAVGKISAANAIPHMLAPKHSTENPVHSTKPKSSSKQGEETKSKSKEKEKVPKEKLDKLFAKLDLSGIENWETEEQKEVRDLIEEYAFLFALDDLDLGKTSVVKHSIKLTDETPFKERYRRIPPHQFEEVKKHLQEMLEIGAIRKSCSPWASAVVLVRKKDGSLRFCIDLRKLNARTVKDAYALPRIDETLDCLNGAQIFSSLDLKAGYWQVEMDEASKPLTAFTVGPLGFYECVRMPFGLTNAPATFQRLMETCLGDLHLSWCIIYLDDIIVFSKTRKEHIQRLRAVFEKLAEAGLKLKPSKCELFKSKISYLGHIVSKTGIETDPSKITAIVNWPRPVTVTDVRSFLGFTNHYRKFIHKYAQIARPLHILTSGENANKKKATVEWNEACEQAFQKLKEICSQTPILAYADYTKPFKLHTDASELGLGAVLYQTQEDGTDRVIAYASRSLNQAEKKYPAHKLEFLALKWSVTDRFHEYLYGGSFDVFTDNNPLTYVLTSAKLDATGQRWIASLADYNFKLHYKSGKTNVEADALSRIPWKETYDEVLEDYVVKAIIDSGSQNETYIPDPISNVNRSEPIIIKSLGLNTDEKTCSKFSREQWIQEQEKEESLKIIRRLIKEKKLSQRKVQKTDSEDLKSMLRHKSRYVLRNNLLYRKLKRVNRESNSLQFVLPKGFQKQALQACHNDVGHLGYDRCIDLLQDRFYWTGMAKDLEVHIKNCDRCLRFKQKPQVAELNPILASYPLELVHIDFLTIESGKDSKDINVLIITDHFTKFAQAFVTQSQTASVVARVLWDKYFMNYGLPTKLLSDQGRNFESELIAELCKLSKVKKLRTTPYRPQGNGQCERFNSTLISMLGTLPPEAKYNWPEQVATLVHAYNCTKSTATSFSPHYLMFGRHPQLPIDIEFGVQTPDLFSTSTHKFVKKLERRLKWAYKKARQVNEKESMKNKLRFDRKAVNSKLEPGDLVLVRQKAFKGKHKLSDRWETNPYVVLEHINPKVPVYRVQSSEDSKKVRVLHRNMLFPLCSKQEEEAKDVEMETNPEILSDDDEANLSVENQQYTGPLTRSRAKAQAKATQEIDMEFNAKTTIAQTKFAMKVAANSVYKRLTKLVTDFWWSH